MAQAGSAVGCVLSAEAGIFQRRRINTNPVIVSSHRKGADCNKPGLGRRLRDNDFEMQDHLRGSMSEEKSTD